MPGNPLRVLVAQSHESESTLYEDDGESSGYRQGDFMKRKFQQVRNTQEVIVNISEPEGKYRPAARDLMLDIWVEQEPKSILLQIEDVTTTWILLPQLAADKLDRSSQGWTFNAGLLTVKTGDSLKTMRFTIVR